MTYPASLEDTSSTPIPISQSYLDGQNAFAATQASPFTHTDGNSNTSSAATILPAPTTLGMPVMFPSPIQKANNITGSAGKILTIAFPYNNLAGNSLIVAIGMGEVETGGGSPITLAVTDSLGNSYTEAIKGTQSTTQEAAIFYATNCLPGANTVTVTIAGSGSSNTAIAAEIYEVEGLITVSSLLVDQTASNSNAGSTAVSTANITPNYANEFAVMAIASAGGTITGATGWVADTNGTLSPTGGGLVSFAAQSRTQMTEGALVPTATLGTSNAWAACTAVFRAMHVQQEGVHVTQGGVATVFGSVNALNADLINMDVSNYKYLSIHFNSVAMSVTITFACSNDNVNWISLPMPQVANPPTQNASYSTPTNNMFATAVYFRYFRARVTSYNSGTPQATTCLYTYSPSYIPVLNASIVNTPSINASITNTPLGATQSGVWSVGLTNGDITIAASAARTTTFTGGDQTNTAARGIRVALNVTIAGSGSITLEIDAKDAASTTYAALLTGVAVTANGTYIYEVYPGLTPVANQVVSDVLPKTWRVVVTANNSNSITYSVGASYLL